jgi:N-acetyl-gamma-glutamyl-phosphate reductase
VVGHTGYSGAELVRLLRRHAAVELVLLDHRKVDEETARTEPVPVAGTHQPMAHLPWDAATLATEGMDVVLTATPPEVSLELVPQILAKGVRAIDLSGAFRLGDAQEYRKWYQAEHSKPELLSSAVYGLPELNREAIRTACLVANPGCYPTAALCALWPLVHNDVIDRGAGIVCDAKSGVSGAGKAPSPKTHFVQVSENFSAYAILKHRHVPEVTGTLGLREEEFSFVAHLLPAQRGILATHYARLKEPMQHGQVADIYRQAYRNSPFIRLYPERAQPQLSAVNGTNFCDLHFTLGADGRRLVVVSCIDNLVKGAAGQAVQNLNVMFGLDECAGLLN